MLKVQLVNDTFGVCNLIYTDPGDLDVFEEAIQRSNDNDGVIYNYTTNLKFNKEGREFIKQCYELAGGIEALVICNIYEYDPNLYKDYIISTGRIKMSNYDIGEIDLITNLDEVGFNVAVSNLIDQDFEYTRLTAKNGKLLPDYSILSLKLQSKTILKEFNALVSEGDVSMPSLIPQGGGFAFQWAFITLNMNNKTVDELNDFTARLFNLVEFNTTTPTFLTDFNLPVYVAKEAGTLDVHFKFVQDWFGYPDINSGSPPAILSSVKIWFRQFNAVGVEYGSATLVKQYDLYLADVPVMPPLKTAYRPVGGSLCDYTQSGITVVDGDQFWLYAEVSTNGVDLISQIEVVTDKTQTFYDWQQATVFPDTTIRAVPAYELCERLVQYMTGQQDCFRSDVLGRVDSSRAYASDGRASMVAFSNGANVRGKRINNGLFFNFKNVITNLVNQWCLSWGYEKLADGTQIVKVNGKEYFYDKTLQIIDLGEVPLVRKKIDTTYFQKQVKVGYSDLKNIKQLNSLDEFNIGRLFSTILTQVKTVADIIVNNRVSGYETENQRRLGASTTDSPLDNDIFMVCSLRDPSSTISKHLAGSGSFTENGSGETVTLDLGLNLPAGNYRVVVLVHMTSGTGDTMAFQLFFDQGGTYVISNTSGSDPMTYSHDGVYTAGSGFDSLTAIFTSPVHGILIDYDYSVDIYYPDPTLWKNERDEHFSGITGLYDPATAYNLRRTPGRILRDWLKIFGASVTKLSNQILSFNSGTGNYTMVSKEDDEPAAFAENDDIDMSGIEPLFEPEVYFFGWSLTRDEWKLFKERSYGYVSFKDKGVPCEGFIRVVKRAPNSKKTTFELLKVYRPR